MERRYYVLCTMYMCTCTTYLYLVRGPIAKIRLSGRGCVVPWRHGRTRGGLRSYHVTPRWSYEYELVGNYSRLGSWAPRTCTSYVHMYIYVLELGSVVRYKVRGSTRYLGTSYPGYYVKVLCTLVQVPMYYVQVPRISTYVPRTRYQVPGTS